MVRRDYTLLGGFAAGLGAVLKRLAGRWRASWRRRSGPPLLAQAL